MDKTKTKLNEYWDGMVAKAIPRQSKFEHAQNEVVEHFSFIKWASKRILLPLIMFYFVMGLLFNMSFFGSLFISLAIFLYSNFLPDVDLLIKKTNVRNKDSLWYEKYFLLFFSPIVMYYIIDGRAKPLYSLEDRCFHNLKTAFIYGIFLLVIGSIFWPETFKRLMLPLFGMLGFILHLIVDGKLNYLAEW
jgi:hypothetical protein